MAYVSLPVASFSFTHATQKKALSDSTRGRLAQKSLGRPFEKILKEKSGARVEDSVLWEYLHNIRRLYQGVPNNVTLPLLHGLATPWRLPIMRVGTSYVADTTPFWWLQLGCMDPVEVEFISRDGKKNKYFRTYYSTTLHGFRLLRGWAEKDRTFRKFLEAYGPPNIGPVLEVRELDRLIEDGGNAARIIGSHPVIKLHMDGQRVIVKK